MSSRTLPREIAEDYEASETGAVIAVVRRDLARAMADAGALGDHEIAARTTNFVGRGAMRELEIGGRRYLVRTLRHGGLLRWLTGARFLDAGRVFRELALAVDLARAGIATPAAVAARARRAPILGWRLEIVTERVEGAVDVGAAIDVIACGRSSPRARRAVAVACGRFVAALHAAGLRHPDLHARNLLVNESALRGAAPRLWVIDLDRAERASAVELASRVACLARFARDLVRGERERGVRLERTDRARFLAAYEPDRGRRRELARAIARALARGRWLHGASWALERRLARRAGGPGRPPADCS